ncbi:MAG: aldose 1-epimerase family protein [Erysipelotrichaceae bacterium]|nr:aldose 1-epimerase family protein [Erysipelotrichaceae bacterium]
MSLTIQNDRISLTTDNPAGQMFSIIDKKTNQELLYQADEGWSGRNPSLFPMVGSTWKKGQYEWKGQTYQMKNHGLIRYEDLDGSICDDHNSILYTFDSNEETRAKYPFDFHFELKYTLIEKGVRIDYAIKNTGAEDLPFSFGLHPAFKTVRQEGEVFEDFSIEFFPKGEAEQILFYSDLSPVKRVPVSLDEWKLSHDDIKNYLTLVYDKIVADTAVLKYKDQPRLKVTFKGFPMVALWNAGKDNNFICIEPWFGHSDFEKVEVPFDQRENTMILAPQDTFTCSYSIETME